MSKRHTLSNNSVDADALRSLKVSTSAAPDKPRIELGFTVSDEPNETGVLLKDVKEGGPAYTAGLRKGDFIISFGGKPTTSSKTKGKAGVYIVDGDRDFKSEVLFNFNQAVKEFAEVDKDVPVGYQRGAMKGEVILRPSLKVADKKAPDVVLPSAASPRAAHDKEITDWRKTVDALRSDKVSTSAAHEKEIADWRKKHDAVKKDMDALRLEKASASTAAHDKEIADLRKTVDSLRSEKVSASAAHEKEIADWRKKHDAMFVSLISLKKELEAQRQENEELKHDLLGSAKSPEQEEIADWRGVNLMDRSVKFMDIDVVDQKEENVQLKIALSEREKEIADLRLQLAESPYAAETPVKNLDSLKEEIAEVRAENNKLKYETNRLKMVVQALEAQVRGEHEREETDAKVSFGKPGEEPIERLARQMVAMIYSLEDDVAYWRKKHDALASANTAMKKELETHRLQAAASIRDLESSNSDLRSKQDELTVAMASLKKKHMTAQKDMAATISALEDDVAESNRRNDSLTASLASTKKELASARAEKTAITSSLEGEIAEWRHKYKTQSGAMMKTDPKDMERVRSEAAVTISSLEADVDLWKQKHDALKRSMESNRLENASNLEKLSTAEEQLEEQRKKNASQNMMLLKLNHDLDVTSKRDEATEEERIKLHGQYQACLRDLEKARSGFVHLPYMGFEANENTIVICVLAGGPAEVAGIRDGDKVLKVGSVAIANLDQFRAAVKGNVHPGMTVPFTLERGEKRLVINVLVQCISMKEPEEF